MPYIYVVYSPREYSEDHESLLMHVVNVQLVWAVKEYGSQGTHPHLNLVYLAGETVRKDNFRTKIYKSVKLSKEEYPNVFCISIETDLPYRAAYITKEDAFNVLYEHPAYKLADYASRYDASERNFQKSLSSDTGKSKMKDVSEKTLISMCIDYFETLSATEDIELGPTIFREWQRMLVKHKFYAKRVSWLRVYNYTAVYLSRDHPEAPPMLLDV